MTIREQQMTALSRDCLEDFENRIAAHLLRCFPSECRALGGGSVQDRIRFGIERSAEYGLTLERDVCKYIDLMFAFGSNFDKDPTSPWASGILRDETMVNPSVKMDRLFAEAKLHASAPAAWSRMQ